MKPTARILTAILLCLSVPVIINAEDKTDTSVKELERKLETYKHTIEALQDEVIQLDIENKDLREEIRTLKGHDELPGSSKVKRFSHLKSLLMALPNPKNPKTIQWNSNNIKYANEWFKENMKGAVLPMRWAPGTGS